MADIIIGAGAASFPTLTEMVSRVFRECLMEPITDLVTQEDLRTLLVIDALNDAQLTIWNRNNWDWKRREGTITWAAGVQDYVLPADYDRSAGPLYPARGQNFPANEWDVTSFRNRFGPFTPTSSSGITDYAIQGTTLRVFPPPAADWIAQYPSGSLAYWRVCPDPYTSADGGDSFDIPKEFVEALAEFAKAKLKEWKGDDLQSIQRSESRFERVLDREIKRTKREFGPRKMRMLGGSMQGMNAED